MTNTELIEQLQQLPPYTRVCVHLDLSATDPDDPLCLTVASVEPINDERYGCALKVTDDPRFAL